MTVKVNEALCEMKEKLQKTERRVREVMKEKKELEKILESKLKMIKVISGSLCMRERRWGGKVFQAQTLIVRP